MLTKSHSEFSLVARKNTAPARRGARIFIVVAFGIDERASERGAKALEISCGPSREWQRNREADRRQSLSGDFPRE